VILIDSCGWIEYFTGGSLEAAFDRYVNEPAILVPTIVIYEVHKVLLRDVSREAADEAAGHLRDLNIAEFGPDLALDAAELSLRHHLSTADAIIYATARAHNATLVTSDAHFENLPGVEYIPAA
jgi:predicted nucleic acid-binding protein